MNYQENQKFLNFIQTLMPTEPLSVYYSREQNGNDYYYFHTGFNCEVKIKSMGNDINFSFKSGIKGKAHNETKDMSVNVSFEDAKPILEQCFQAWQKRKMDDFLFHNNLTLEDVKKDLDFINSYLQVTDLSKRFQVQQETLNIFLKSPENNEYEVRVGRLYKEIPDKKNILHICEIPVVLKNRGLKAHVYIEHVIPGWEIANYEGLNPVLTIDNGVNSLQNFSDKLKEINSEMGTLFLAVNLDYNLPNKKINIKSLKI